MFMDTSLYFIYINDHLLHDVFVDLLGQIIGLLLSGALESGAVG